MKITTLEEAKAKIKELEKENKKLKEELEYYKNRKLSGRRKHNEKWMAAYNDFVVCYESGMSFAEIAKKNGVSERTIYRYKAYYDEVHEQKTGKMSRTGKTKQKTGKKNEKELKKIQDML